MSQLGEAMAAEDWNDRLTFATPLRGGDDLNTSTESFLTPLHLPKKSTPSKLKNSRRKLKQLDHDKRSPDPLHLARRTNTALTRKRAERERSVYATKEPRAVIIGFLDRLLGLRETPHVPVSGLAIALQDLVRVRDCGRSSQALQQQQMPAMPETPKPTVFEPSPEMPKWSSMAFGAQPSPLMATTADDGFMQQFGPSSSSPAESIQQLSSRQSDFLEPLGAYSQRMSGYRYERMNCDLGFRFDRAIPLRPTNLLNTNAARSSCLPQSPSNKLSMPLRRVTFTTRYR